MTHFVLFLPKVISTALFYSLVYLKSHVDQLTQFWIATIKVFNGSSSYF